MNAIGLTPWFAPYVARHENHLRQFVDSSGSPSISGDGGVGIFQLTNPPAACNQVWFWKDNVAEGTRRLRAFVTQAKNWMSNQRSQAAEQNQGTAPPVPKTVEANCVFAENTSRTIEDAVALKMFNGASRGNYCSWDNANNKWKFNPTNNLNFNYVNRVCSLVPAS